MPIIPDQGPVRCRFEGGPGDMVRAATLIGLSCWISLLAGCRCFPAMEKYHDTIDTVSDFKIHWDRWYYPPWDVSRAGRPDWCSSKFNRWLCPCRCQQGVWYGYEGCQHYPPNHPYALPTQSVPLVGILTPPATEKARPIEEMKTPEIPPYPQPAPIPEPAPPDTSRRDSSSTWQPVSGQTTSLKPSWMEVE
ncbi:MAG TPA: hypothetical protein VFG20_12210 [Planctomycetaceae bacterium]|nr:hypothetical protein [Planctomycetaceae bacterium]